MSFFKKLLVSTENASSWFLSINTHGECIMYAIDAKGDPATFATGKVTDVLLEAIRAVYPLATLNLNQDTSPTRFDCNRWRDVLAILQGPATGKRKTLITIAWENVGFFRHFLGGGPGCQRTRFTLTAPAIKYDEEMDRRQAERESKTKNA